MNGIAMFVSGMLFGWAFDNIVNLDRPSLAVAQLAVAASIGFMAVVTNMTGARND